MWAPWYPGITPRGGPTASRRDGGPTRLHDWLTSRVDEALEDDEPTDRSWARREATIELDDEEVEDPETVLAGAIARQAWLELEEEEDDEADRTVQRAQMPVSFIKREAVTVDDTVADERLPPGWRQMLLDDEARATPPPPRPPRTSPPPLPAALREDDAPEGVPVVVWVVSAGILALGAGAAALLLA